jgi:DNA-binding beta-propeller fold protein YncE
MSLAMSGAHVVQAVALWLAASLSPAAMPAGVPLKLLLDVPMTGGPTRFDYQWVDPDRRRLYIAHLGSDELVVFDIDARKIVGQVKALPSVHGVIAAPAKHRLFATVTGAKQLAIIDDGTLEVLARVPAGEYPNGLTYADKHEKVYVSNNSGLGLGVIDVHDNKALPGIDIGTGAGNSQYDPVGDHVVVVSHGKPALVVVDPGRDVIVERYALAGVAGCHGLLVNAPARRAYVACAGGGHPKLVAFDLADKRQIVALPIPPHPDVLAFDPGLRRLYVSSGTGKAAVFEETAAGLRSLGEGFVGPNTHTVSVDPRTHAVFFPIEDLGGHPVLRIMTPRDRPSTSR